MKVASVLMTVTTVAALGCNMARDRGSDVLIGSESFCPSCSIVLDSVATLKGVFLRGEPTTIARDPQGRIYLQDAADALLKMFGSDGRFVRQIGRRGGGPGDYEVIRNVLVGRDGSLQLLDAALSRRSWFSTAGHFVRSTPVLSVVRGLGMSAVLLPDDRIVVNAFPRSSEESGYALHLIDNDGKTTDLFGDAPPSDPRRPWLQKRLLWVRANGELLVARPFTFGIDLYSSDFTKKVSLKRVEDWIPSHDPAEEPSDGLFDKPPTPMLLAMWEDPEGLLWLYMAAPSRSWKAGPALDEVRQLGLTRDRLQALGSRPRLDAIIEVLDLERRQILARYRLNGFGAPFGGGYIASNREDESGEPSLVISRVELKR